MVFHHFDDPWKVARECGHVLRPGGRIFVRAATVEQIPAYPYVPFIPASRPLLEERLPKKELVMQVFEAAGLQTMSVGVVVQEIAATYAAYVEKLAAGGDSILASLTASDLENGFDAIRAHSGKVDPKPVSEPIDVFVFG
jgi:SAM-dependent methyltransferase